MKNKAIHFLAVLVLLAGIVFPLQVSGTAPGDEPREVRRQFPFAVLAETEIDLGKVPGGSPVSGVIRITNEGAEDLLVGKVRGSCGLMIGSWPAEPVAQGEQLQISFRFDGNRLGPFERLITIHTNAWQKDLVVSVRGEILPPGQAMPTGQVVLPGQALPPRQHDKQTF